MTKKEEILQMYFGDHKKQESIAELVGVFTKLYLSSNTKRFKIY